jgi:hypothetical protein
VRRNNHNLAGCVYAHGSPIAGQAIVLSDPPEDWRDDIASRYACISPSYSTGDTDDDEDEIFVSDKETHGPALK